MKRFIIVCVIIALIVSGFQIHVKAADKAKGTTFRIEKVTGSVTVGKSKAKTGMQLYSGDTISTSSDSSAYISLDSSKVLKLAENTSVTISKSGKKLEARVSEGEMFFDVNKKLADDESMTVGTASMSMSIRGTSGVVIVTYDEDIRHDIGYVFCGTVEVTAGKDMFTMWGGEGVDYYNAKANRDLILISELSHFVKEKIAEDPDLAKRVEEDSGLDVETVVEEGQEDQTDSDPTNDDKKKNNDNSDRTESNKSSEDNSTDPNDDSSGGRSADDGSPDDETADDGVSDDDDRTSDDEGNSNNGGSEDDGNSGNDDSSGDGGDSGSSEPCSHTYGNGKVKKEATCTEDGVKVFTCTKCGETKKEKIAALGHSYDDGEVTKDATCVAEGEMTYTCSECSKTKTETIPATGEHNYDDGNVTKEASHTEEGSKLFTCVDCGDTYTEILPKIETHDYVMSITKLPTDKEPGVLTFTCVCGDTYTEEIPAIGDSEI